MATSFRIFLMVLVGSLPLALAAQTAHPVGRILLSHGSASAENPEGKTRVLRRLSELYVGDRISTGPNGFLQARMTDGAIFALKNETDFSIHAYTTGGRDDIRRKVAVELHKGGLRTIDGLIGKQDEDEYVLVTPDVDVFLAGGSESTTFECVLQDGITYCGVYAGSAMLSNLSGSLELDFSGTRNYAEIESRVNGIRTLDNSPVAMGKFVFPLPGAGQ